MAQVISDRRDIEFVLYEQLKVDELSKTEVYAEFNRKTIDLILSEARNLAIKELLPAREIGDQQGCMFDKGKVSTPDAFKRIYELIIEGEWIAMSENPDWGGQGMPVTVAMGASEYFNGANFPLMIYAGLTHGAARLIESFGTDKQKALFLKKMYSGKWTGTMLLTEPDAGSDVGALTTSAVKNEDGTYSISGNKIFISAGEHDLTENIIHPVLARIEGAPPGTKGISLFIVPKIWVNDDGALGEPNDVVCTGIEEKMGIHGNSTCALTLGGSGKCRGLLLGEENKGMRAMFQMMNEARLLVGLQGFCCSSSAYLYALNYARERIQGKHLLQFMDKNAPSVPIIQHPDVRRMLLTMKAYVEGMRSLLYYTALCSDKAHITHDPKEKATYEGLIDVLIPIAKGYVTDRAFDVCSQAVQIYGGYGYIKGYPVEQLLRDCRITMIYEGTNGIQAMDLLGRKLGLNKGKAVMDLLGEMQKTVASAKSVSGLQSIAEKVELAINKLAEVGMHMGASAMSEKVLTTFAFAYPFMEVTGDVVMAWMLLWRAGIAARNLEAGAKKKEQAFYEGQIKSAEYFAHALLPVTLGKMKAILAGCGAAVEISEEAFGG